MAPKKRKPPAHVKPGVGSQFLCQNFSELPDHPEDVLKGHVLHQFAQCHKSRALTVKRLATYLKDNTNVIAIPEEHVVFLNQRIDLAVQRVKTQSKKLKKLTDAKELSKFSELCNEKMPLDLSSLDVHIPAAMPIITNPEIPLASQSTDPEVPLATTKPLPKSPLKTRQSSKCVSCKRFKLTIKQLDEKHKKRLKEEKMKVVTNMTAKQKKNKAVRVLSQKVKRKDKQLDQLKDKIGSSDMAEELSTVIRALSSAEKKHRQMKRDRQGAKSKAAKNLMSKHEKTTSAMRNKLDKQSEEIQRLQNEKMVLEDQVREMKEEKRDTKVDGKTYSSSMRMMVYDAVVNQVPTSNISPLLESFSTRSGINFTDVPHRTTAEAMTRELGVIAELQAAEIILANKNCTLGFDATTQEGIHVNSIHVTTQSECYAVAVDELAGGTAVDYHGHITDSIDSLASVHCNFSTSGSDYSEIREKIIDNITNTLTDRCSANHATIELVNASWNKTLNELNCHLHPLDTLSTKTRSALKQQEVQHKVTLPVDKSKLYGSDCVAGNIVLALNKLRYKDGKGDPKGFKVFLDNEGLPRGLIPRYRGNRLHVLFHTAGILVHHYDVFKRLLEKGTSCGGLRKALHDNFETTATHVELQVLGLLGKLLTGPWMRKFYTSADNQIHHLEGINVVRNIVSSLKDASPMELLYSKKDFFENLLHEPAVDEVIKSLMEPPRDPNLFKEMMKACLDRIVEVLERQFEKYFDCEITEPLEEQTKSARSHNIDAEEIMGMFSPAKKKSPNATICFISCKMRAQKNRTVEYLDGLSEERREVILKKVVQFGQKQRKKRKMKQKDLMAELVRRESEKQQARDMGDRRKLEKKLKSIEIDKLGEEFSEVSAETLENLVELMSGKSVGKELSHVWVEDGDRRVLYNGRIVKLKGRVKKDRYTVTYWSQDETDEDGIDYDMTIYELGADLIAGDLVM